MSNDPCDFHDEDYYDNPANYIKNPVVVGKEWFINFFVNISFLIISFLKNIQKLFTGRYTEDDNRGDTGFPGIPGPCGPMGMMGAPADFFYKEWCNYAKGTSPEDFMNWFTNALVEEMVRRDLIDKDKAQQHVDNYVLSRGASNYYRQEQKRNEQSPG